MLGRRRLPWPAGKKECQYCVVSGKEKI